MNKRIIGVGRASGAFLFAATMLFAAVMTGCGGRQPAEEPASVSQLMPVSEPADEPAADPVPEPFYTLEIGESVEDGDAVVVSTTYGSVRYPFAFSDLIHFVAENDADHAMLEFTADIDDVEAPLYTIVFNGQEGILLGSMSIPDSEEPVPVYAELHAPEEELEEGDLATFYAAQETFNDVVVSLGENEGFMPAE